MAVVDFSGCDSDSGVFVIGYQFDDVSLVVQSVTYVNNSPVNSGSTRVVRSGQQDLVFTVPPNTPVTTQSLIGLNVTLTKHVQPPPKSLTYYSYPVGTEVFYAYPV
jgi:hypothetical protein